MGNLIKNEDEIMVTITYIVYDNGTNAFSSTDKKDLSKIPWLNPLSHEKQPDEDQFQDTNDLPKFILTQRDADDPEVINVSDNNDDAQGIKTFKLFNFLIFKGTN